MSDAIQALVWDFGGVLMRTEDQGPRQRWEERLNLKPGELHDIVFKCKASRLATIGLATTEDIWREVGERLNLEAEMLAELQRDFWAGDQLDRGLISTTRALRQHIKTALLSNAWPGLRSYLEKETRIGDAFDQLIISAELGFAKPDQRLYSTLVEQLGVPAESCIFIDDRTENVRAAEELDIQAIEFHSRDQVLMELGRLLPSELAALLPD